MENSLRKKFIGDKRFYKMVLMVAVPIMIQNGLTNFVNLLDNIMVGQLGTEEMSGVAIVNQLVVVYNLCIFGAASGAGLFTAQFYGKGDKEGIRHTFRFKILSVAVITLLAVLLFVFFGKDLILMYLAGETDGGDLQLTLESGWRYLQFILIGFVPFMLEQAYSSTLRECGETVLPMKAGAVSVVINLALNYLLIFGKFGFPELGVAGAAIATSASRFVGAGMLIVWTHTHPEKYPFVKDLYKTFRIPGYLVRDIIKTGTPLLLNEGLWSAASAMLAQCYSIRGLNAVAAYNITTTLFNLFYVVIIAIGVSISIILGQLLGAGKLEEARVTSNKLIAFSLMCSVGIGIALAASAPFFPLIYNTTDAARELATGFMCLQAMFLPQCAFVNASYFTLRSGGKTIITFFFDSVYAWCVSVPAAFLCSRFTDWHILVIYILVNILDWIKCGIGLILLKKGVWIRNIVDTPEEV